MTASTGLVATLADVVILLTLSVAASNRVSQVARPVIATLAFVCAWLLTAVFVAVRGPTWTILMGVTLIVVSLVVVTVTLHLWTQGGDGGKGGPEHRGDPGGGGPPGGRPDGPRGERDASEPSWWPEFERHLASYIAERERETAQLASGGTRRRPSNGGE